tara:strand:- start:338 stop:535 length:198 start_codon:yes stop_codon:yes gene_type:complete
LIKAKLDSIFDLAKKEQLQKESDIKMKYLLIAILCLNLASCGTIGGAIQGFGSDLDQVGGYITDF